MALCVVALIYMVWMHYFGEENFSRNERMKENVEYVEDVQEDGSIVIEEEEDDIIIEDF
jgi:surface antigen